MGFSQMMELLQKKNQGKIVFCNAGNFYIAIGKDAVLLNSLLGLKVSGIKPEMCKVGFPINSLEKYTDLLIQKRYSYAIYYFDQEKEELQIIEDYEGKKEYDSKRRTRKQIGINSKGRKIYRIYVGYNDKVTKN